MSEEEKCSDGKKPEEKTIETSSPAVHQPSHSDHQGKRKRGIEYFDELRAKYYDT